MTIALSIETLQNAYDICLLVKDLTGNVIASGDFEQSDIENYEKSKQFMAAYDRAFRNKPDRKKVRGDWINRLKKAFENLQSGIEELNKIKD